MTAADDARLIGDQADEIDRLREKNTALLAAMREIASEHDRLERDPAQHCTNLVRIARAVIAKEKEQRAKTRENTDG